MFVKPYGGLRQKSWTALVLTLTLLSEESPVIRETHIIGLETPYGV